MSNGVTNAKVEEVGVKVAVLQSEFDTLKSTVTAMDKKIDTLIASKPGFKDMWAPIGVGITAITIIATLAASGPLQHLKDVDDGATHTAALVAAQGQDLSSARAERQQLGIRVQRLEAIADRQSQALFSADASSKPPVAKTVPNG